MSDLETNLTEWRQQMLSAGITFPVPLEELEAHLREEIEQNLQSGLNEAEAFQSAVKNLGQAHPLKTEFAKATGFWNWFGEDNFTRTNRILGVLWAADSFYWLFYNLVWNSRGIEQERSHFNSSWFWGLMILFYALGLLGITGGVCLFRNFKIGRRLILIAAWMQVAMTAIEMATIGWVYILFAFYHMQVRPLLGQMLFSLIYLAFYITTLWLLYSPQFGKRETAK